MENMGEKRMPENIIVDILSRLPVKPLIRFRCVSKQCRSIISDQHFAKSQFENKTHRHRRLVYFLDDSDIESLDLETPPPWTSFRRLTCPFQYQDRTRRRVHVVGSCNGMVCVSTRYNSFTCLYIWNPSTGFSLKLPHPGFPNHIESSNYCGFGYLPATDDYKVLVAAFGPGNVKSTVQVRVFSTRGGIWKRIESPFRSSYVYPDGLTSSAALLGVTLHWVMSSDVIHAFDLVKEECREMQAGLDRLLDVDSWGGCLYVFRKNIEACGCIELWVMREYGVSDSWTKLFKFKILNKDVLRMSLDHFLATETSTVVAKSTSSTVEIIRIEHGGEDEPRIIDKLPRRFHVPAMIVVDESIFGIPDRIQDEQNNRRSCSKAEIKRSNCYLLSCSLQRFLVKFPLFHYSIFLLLLFSTPV